MSLSGQCAVEQNSFTVRWFTRAEQPLPDSWTLTVTIDSADYGLLTYSASTPATPGQTEWVATLQPQDFAPSGFPTYIWPDNAGFVTFDVSIAGIGGAPYETLTDSYSKACPLELYSSQLVVDCLEDRPWADVDWSIGPGDPLPDSWRVTVTFDGYPPLSKTVSAETFEIRFWSDEFGFPTTYWPATLREPLDFYGEIEAVGGHPYDTTYHYERINAGSPVAGQPGCPVYFED